MENICVDIKITGTVQGVGFRPFVYRTALKHDVTGRVCNNSSGVSIHALGKRVAINSFVTELREFPPLPCAACVL